ncbi:MauE/DoxX family redox-associated membrane protein [Chloroflexota bacterium]
MQAVRPSKTTIVRVCAVILGLVFLAAGTGKVLGQIDFTHALESSFFAPAVAGIVARYLPWVEIGLGLLLVTGLVAKMTAILSVVLISGFITSNSWALITLPETAITCYDCFGVWETLLGYLSPTQALHVDLVLLSLALVILVLAPAPALLFRAWANLGDKS